ncbi:MAG: nuclear pore complex subunit, partial [Bacteroidetes bacterium HGW-Bacteroidetes-12]
MEQVTGLFIKGTSKTPEVNFKRGFISISGRSIPEDSVTFYQPLVKWIESYITNPEGVTRVDFKIEYINSGSNRFIFNILRLLNESYKQGNKVLISWLFEEDD